MSKKSKKVYFPNLDGLRFIAAFLVIIHHVELSKMEFKLSHEFYQPTIQVIGKLGVTLFFVLSGFLITYLLMIEKERTKTVAVGKFYLRRVMRIWPLYFLIVIFSLFIAPHIPFLAIPEFEPEVVQSHLWIKAFLFLFFLPNLLMVGLGVIPFAGQTWSIGTEEQFYLMWPWIMRKSKNRLRVLLIILGIYVSVMGLLSLDQLSFHPFAEVLAENYYYQLAKRFWGVFNIDIMAIGGIAAVLVYEKKEKALQFLFHKNTQIINLLAIITLIAFGVWFPILHFEIYGILFAILIVNLASNPNTIFSLEYPILKYFGKISYGIYMYHSLVIVIVMKLLRQWDMFHDYLIYPLSMILTLVFAAVSYEFFEKQFLKLKKKFVIVDSGAKV